MNLFIYALNTFRNILNQRKKNTRLNQVMPVSPISVEKSEEKLTSNKSGEKLESNDQIECSVIIGDQLVCNQQLCHVKWSSDQARQKKKILLIFHANNINENCFSSTPTAKLIYVQPCNSSDVNKICPACKKSNCEQCSQTKKE